MPNFHRFFQYNFILLGLLSLILSGCSPQYKNHTYAPSGELLPKIAVAPVLISSPHPILWDYSEELSHYFEENLRQVMTANLLSYEKMIDSQSTPPASLWNSSDLRLAQNYKCDFLVLIELIDYDRRHIVNRHGIEGEEEILRVKSKVRVINLTTPHPTLALQKYLQIDDIIIPKQLHDNAHIHDWKDPDYRNSHYGIATAKITQKMAQWVAKECTLSWKRRPSISQ